MKFRRECKNCGGEIPESLRSPTRKYCCRKCFTKDKGLQEKHTKEELEFRKVYGKIPSEEELKQWLNTRAKL